MRHRQQLVDDLASGIGELSDRGEALQEATGQRGSGVKSASGHHQVARKR